ncbi:MAG: carboxypeptidase regulatory-like domain-containing protein [Planctomycetes bacterium]|nr:carboxypeptidase regulatory-like domain-containing protein [Planctomycetota bacterium]
MKARSTRRVVLACAVLLLCATSIWLALRQPRGREVPSASLQEQAEEQDASNGMLPNATQIARRNEVTSDEASTSNAATNVVAPKSAPDLRAAIRGRVLDDLGAPLAGASITLHGWGSNEERVARFGLPAKWEDALATSDAAGRFLVRFETPPAYQFTLDLNAEGWVERSWRWSQLEQGTALDLGDIQLVRGGRIYGRILDAQGAELRGFRSVAISEIRTGIAGGAQPFSKSISITAGDVRYEAHGLPPGKFRVAADWGSYVWSKASEVTLGAGEAQQVDLVYEGPDLARRIVVMPFDPHRRTWQLEVREITLHGAPDGPRRVRHEHGRAEFTFDDLPPGTYRAVIDDPRFLPAERAGLIPGSGYRLDVTGSSALELRVVDAANDEPIEPYRLVLRDRSQNSSHQSKVLRERGAEAPPGGVYAGLLPGAWVIEVEAEGYGSARVELEDCAPNARRAARVELAKPASLVVQVLDAEGAPLRGVQLMLWPEFALDPQNSLGPESQRQQSRQKQQSTLREGATDAEGRFHFEAVGAGRYELEAWRSAVSLLRVAPLALSSGATEEQTLRWPALGSLHVQVLLHELFPREAVELRAERVIDPNDAAENLLQLQMQHRPQSLWNDLRAAIDARGEARFADLPPGRWMVWLAPRQRAPADRATPIHAFCAVGIARVEPNSAAELVLDLSDRLPIDVQVLVKVNGLPAEGARVSLEIASEVAKPRQALRVEATTDREGLARMAGLLSGDYALQAYARNGAFRLESPRPIALTPGTTAPFEVHFTLARGRLQCVDEASGAPLVRRQISLFSPSGNAHPATDDQGFVEVELPPGNYHVRDVASEMTLRDREAPIVRWPPEPNGSTVVRLPVAK